jgi:RNA polymerase sigma-70 factor (ECF subfamily)
MDTERLYVQVLRCQTGDPAAFGELHRQFSGRTLRYLRGMLGEAQADDVQQEVWLTVYRRIAEVANPAGFRTWLYRVTRHRAIDAIRRERRRSELLEADVADVDAIASPGPEPRGDLDPAVMEPLLGRLSAAHREVLVLRFWEDLSYGEIAIVMGCSVGTVRSRLHHAKERMRELLKRSES